MKLVKLVTDKHDSSKIRIRKALVKLLSNPQTSEEEIKTVLDITKDYMKFAEFE